MPSRHDRIEEIARAYREAGVMQLAEETAGRSGEGFARARRELEKEARGLAAQGWDCTRDALVCPERWERRLRFVVMEVEQQSDTNLYCGVVYHADYVGDGTLRLPEAFEILAEAILATEQRAAALVLEELALVQQE